MSRLLSLIREHKLMSVLIGGTVAADVGYYCMHDLIKSYQAYRVSCTRQSSTEMLDVSPEVASLINAAGDRLGIEPGALKRLRLFVCRGVDPARYGRLSVSGLQSFLGLPEHYNYRPTDTEGRHSLFFDERALSLNTKKGKQLYRDCLLLTDEEKGFVMARELAYLTSYATHVPPVFGSCASAGLLGTLYWLFYGKGTDLLQLLTKSSTLKFSLMTSLLTVASGGLWGIMCHQWYAAYYKSLDARVDRRAAAAYPGGAASFYQKQVKRNTLLRDILGEKEGKKYFTIKGNEIQNWVLSDPFLPVNQRWSKLRYDQTLAAREAATKAAAAAPTG